MSEPLTKICPVCGKEFQTTRPKAICCGEKCTRVRRCAINKGLDKKRTQRNREARPELHKQCPICGKNFLGKSVKQVCCCDTCSRVYMKKQFKERYEKEKAAKQPLPVLQKICPQCGKEFQTNLINKKFCSQECQARHNREVKYVAPEWKKERECLFCCEPFIPTQPNQLLCSKKCREEHIALQNKLRYAEKVEELPVLHNLCPTNFKDGVCDTSAFDNLYKRASQGDYIHYADFNLGF